MDKTVRILAVLPGMWARGGEISTLNLLTGLRHMRYNKLYFHAALRQNLPADMELNLLPRLKRVCRTVTWGIHADRGGLHANLSECVDSVAPDVLIYSWDKSIPKYAPNAKSVMVVHGIAQNDFDAYDATHTDAVVCVSRYAAELALSHGIPKEKIHTIPNGVPEAEGKNERSEWGIPADAWVWCFVGGMNRLKRPNLLITALSQRAKAWDDEYAIFAGLPDGGMRLEEYAEALGVSDRCIFLGHTDVPGNVYRSSNCLVITSERESMPLTILEAMSVGLQIVANDVGGISEVIKPECGVLTDVTNWLEFDNALSLTRCMSGDPEVAETAKTFWRVAYSHSVMTESYLQLFKQLLQGA